jgi:hypothetical protein
VAAVGRSRQYVEVTQTPPGDAGDLTAHPDPPPRPPPPEVGPSASVEETATKQSRRRRSAAYWVLVTCLTVVTLGPGLVLSWLSQLSDYSASADSALSGATLTVLSNKPADTLRVAMFAAPTNISTLTSNGQLKLTNDTYEIAALAIAPDGQIDESAKIALVYNGNGTSTARVPAGFYGSALVPLPMVGSAPRMHTFSPPVPCPIVNVRDGTAPCNQLQAWVLPTDTAIGVLGMTPPEGGDAALEVSPSPAIVGAKSLNLYLPAVQLVNRTASDFAKPGQEVLALPPTSWDTAYADSFGFSSTAHNVTIQDCVGLPPGYSVIGSSSPLDEEPVNQPQADPVCPDFLADAYASLTTHGANQPALRVEVASAQLSDRSTAESFLGGILVGVGASLLTSVLYDWISRLVRS